MFPFQPRRILSWAERWPGSPQPSVGIASTSTEWPEIVAVTAIANQPEGEDVLSSRAR